LKRRKHCLSIALALIATTTSSAVEVDTNQVVPLKKYIETHKLDDPAANSYVHSRCIGLFLAFAVASKNQLGTEAEKFHANAQSAYVDLTKSLAMLTLRTTKDPDSAMKERNETNKRLQKMYTTAMDTTLDQGRDLEANQLIDGDLTICAALVKQVRTK
jgi:hypothetical protein